MRKKQKRRRYTLEFKAEAVRLGEDHPHPTKLADELGVPHATFLSWLEAARKEAGLSTPSGNGDTTTPMPEDPEVARLRKELERVTAERDFLKKAAAFFAKSQS